MVKEYSWKYKKAKADSQSKRLSAMASQRGYKYAVVGMGDLGFKSFKTLVGARKYAYSHLKGWGDLITIRNAKDWTIRGSVDVMSIRGVEFVSWNDHTDKSHKTRVLNKDGTFTVRDWDYFERKARN